MCTSFLCKLCLQCSTVSLLSAIAVFESIVQIAASQQDSNYNFTHTLHLCTTHCTCVGRLHVNWATPVYHTEN